MKIRNSEICRAIQNYLILANFNHFSQYSLISVCPAQGSGVVISSAVWQFGSLLLLWYSFFEDQNISPLSVQNFFITLSCYVSIALFKPLPSQVRFIPFQHCNISMVYLKYPTRIPSYITAVDIANNKVFN